jgi:nucleotide-binding universal stress UspA family protein
MADVTHKLTNSLEGALAGGGDPATSPLYVFGPFLKMIVIAGVASITFGPTIWLVVFTIVMVSAMYRLVMIWIIDGSGGSGLSEEEFGGWAVKINAAITFIEYTLTFLVSMAALITFIADRFPELNHTVLGIQYRTFVAILLSLVTGWLVNRGPKTAARAFGPATAGVLLLLWAMIFATLRQRGFELPELNLQAFSFQYVHFTFAGFTRMLAVMTGIEVFANLVAAYDGPPRQKSNKAFGSLAIIMGTTIVTMLIVSPAIYALSNPIDESKSVFTQTMDALLPQWLSYLGTLIGVAVLLSACAASAQGLQNLFLGLRNRHYVPAFLGQRNRFDVADKPVWLQVGLVTLIFLLAGTKEETYLALYAAGVFILLSMTGWAAAKRLLREIRRQWDFAHVAVLVGTFLAAATTTTATLVIFEERFIEGAWMYLIFIPLLYAGFTYSRNRLGEPGQAVERLGELEEAMQAGFGFGQAFEVQPVMTLQPATSITNPPGSELKPASQSRWRGRAIAPQNILVPLDGSQFAEQSLPIAEMLARTFQANLTLVSVLYSRSPMDSLTVGSPLGKRETYNGKGLHKYLDRLSEDLFQRGIHASYAVLSGPAADTINQFIDQEDFDLVVLSNHGRNGFHRRMLGNVAKQLIQTVSKPVLLIRPRQGVSPPAKSIRRLLVTLDGSEFSERVLPYVKATSLIESEVLLLRVPQVPEAHLYGAMIEEIQQLRQGAEEQARDYLEKVSAALQEEGINARPLVKGSRPANTIVSVAKEEKVDVIMLATHGRGEIERLFLGSIADRVVHQAPCPVFLVPIGERRVLS